MTAVRFGTIHIPQLQPGFVFRAKNSLIPGTYVVKEVVGEPTPVSPSMLEKSLGNPDLPPRVSQSVVVDSYTGPQGSCQATQLAHANQKTSFWFDAKTKTNGNFEPMAQIRIQ